MSKFNSSGSSVPLYDLLIKQGLDLLKKEEVKSNLREQYKTLVKIIFAEIHIYIYILLIFVFFIFIFLFIILFILIVRVFPVKEMIGSTTSSIPVGIFELPKHLFYKPTIET